MFCNVEFPVSSFFLVEISFGLIFVILMFVFFVV